MIVKNYIIEGEHQKPIVIDVFFNPSDSPKPVVIFCHGYKGFKDWGAWNLMATYFAEHGFVFIKFNFSHNGGSVTQPLDFPDLEAFGNNNYTKELDDLGTVLNWVCNNETIATVANLNTISLIGHSRGGGIILIKAEEDIRVKNVISLASVCDFGKRTATIGNIEQWKKDGVKYILNGRTKQHMPHYYQFYEDFKANEERLTIERAVKNLKIPHLIIHGDADTSVSINEGQALHTWNPHAKFKVIKGADHVFGAKHPWNYKEMPMQLKEAVAAAVDFLK